MAQRERLQDLSILNNMGGEEVSETPSVAVLLPLHVCMYTFFLTLLGGRGKENGGKCGENVGKM